MFTISKAFVALMATTAVVAAPNKRQTDLVICQFLMIPNAYIPPNSIDLDSEMTYVIGRALSQQVPNTTLKGSNLNITNNDGTTVSVRRTCGIDGKTAVETAWIVDGLVGARIGGLATNAYINWYLAFISC
ncbi:hypothetical protein D9619_007727 [Psilocybe cf. subviscida]|uniref:Uncharacterized protein n=1 Tax=Psilocybe cf. subviscida TaxID=2480587 RepID=A0A8H5ATX6_9AGAR|nr:hypothetical protein D9619_007727 [Psilocybe cf. subviscida]